jgi:flagellar biosynthesis GTPase FlhF
MSSLWSRFNDSGAHEDQLIMSETAREMRFKLLASTVGTIAKQLCDGEYMRDALQSTCATSSSRNDRALARATLGIMDCHDNRDLRRLERELEGMRKEEVVLRREANALEARIENLRRIRASKKELRDGVWPMPPTTDEEDEVDGQEEDEAEEEEEEQEEEEEEEEEEDSWEEYEGEEEEEEKEEEEEEKDDEEEEEEEQPRANIVVVPVDDELRRELEEDEEEMMGVD